jgi:hypothetical protein
MKRIRDGIHFGLNEADYHNDSALGSTDIRRLLRSAPDYWWSSSLNPLRPDTAPTPAQSFGRAVHKFVLEGRGAFEANYAPTDFPGNTKDGKAERAAIEAARKIPLKRDDYNRILLSGQMIRMNPHLSEAFANGFPEVSVFWTRADGTRCKCRFDYLKMRANTDLKSTRNSRNIDFAEACRRSLTEYRYEIQADYYNEGRAQMAGFFADGLVFGDHDREWLAKAVAVEAYAFVFVFWQAESAPITWACSLSPGNPILDAGRRDIEAAIARYREFLDRFGLEQPWVLAEPVQELDINELPRWSRAAQAA